jgi:hypothetical protein
MQLKSHFTGGYVPDQVAISLGNSHEGGHDLDNMLALSADKPKECGSKQAPHDYRVKRVSAIRHVDGRQVPIKLFFDDFRN